MGCAGRSDPATLRPWLVIAYCSFGGVSLRRVFGGPRRVGSDTPLRVASDARHRSSFFRLRQGSLNYNERRQFTWSIMPLAAGTRLGAYEIVSPLGSGGMGEVYRARDHHLGREVAIKVLPSGLLDTADRAARFEREARVLGVAQPSQRRTRLRLRSRRRCALSGDGTR